MNYRHCFHAGNFADVMKHVLLGQLFRAMQKKEKGFLYLDTHAGSGGYDLTTAATGDTLERKPEWPEGIGRIADRGDLPGPVAELMAAVREFDRQQGNTGEALQHYPGSPWLARRWARPQERLALYERQPEECARLREAMQFSPRTVVCEENGYGAPRALLPPPERRALVLIDPPFEAQDEFEQILTAVRDGWRRLPSAVVAVWYPLTERARVDAFFDELRAGRAPPTLAAELMIVGENSPVKLKGCGLAVINPPWQFDLAAGPVMAWLGDVMAQAPGGGGRVEWIVRE